MPTSRVTAVVLNYAREGLTTVCIEALERSASPAPAILIVDNASPDGSGERLRAKYPQHGYLQTNENLGYAGGNALGIARALDAGAEYVLVINDDAEVAAGAVRQLVAALDADARAGAAGPTIRYDDAAGTLCWAGGEFDVTRALGIPLVPFVPRGDAASETRVCTFVSGCCVLLRASALREAGSFRAEYFAYVEDAELSLRFTRAGWRLLHVPAAEVVHHTPWPEPPLAPWKLRLRDLNRRRLVDSHYAGVDRLRFSLWFYPTRLARIFGYLMRGDRSRAGAVWRGMTDPLSATRQA